MQKLDFFHYVMIVVFVIGYLAIIFENYIKVNKTASGLLMAVATWTLLFAHGTEPLELSVETLGAHIGDVSQIVFFLIGAMTLVELIDSHRGFKIITANIKTRSKKKMLWIVGLVSFFLSAILDNLTTTVLMVSLLKKLVPQPKERLILGATVVICANAGGVWTPIGDVTTTMLWINGQLTTLALMKSLFLPSFFSMIVTLLLLGFRLKGEYNELPESQTKIGPEPGGKIVLVCGIGGLIFVPIFKAMTGLPPFMGMLVSLGILWLITDLMHYRDENRFHLRIPHILTKIDTSGVLFFLGILLTINSLEAVGILKNTALFLENHINNLPVIATLIGLISAVVDNVPLVAATMGMYDLQVFPADSALWHMIAYCAGTGGSILIIGSAAGVALMGLEKVDFVWYLKKISLTALVGYLAGMVLYLLLSAVSLA